MSLLRGARLDGRRYVPVYRPVTARASAVPDLDTFAVAIGNRERKDHAIIHSTTQQNNSTRDAKQQRNRLKWSHYVAIYGNNGGVEITLGVQS